jgi:hypothetical protein
LSDLIILSEATITAENLTVNISLEMQGSGSLAAISGTSITITKDVKMNFRAKGDKLPFLDLGQIGETYDIVPAELIVDVDAESFKETNLSELKHKLVAGHTLSNCELWAAQARLSDRIHFNLTCMNGNAMSVRLLDEGERALFLVGVERSSSESVEPSPTDKSDPGLTQTQLILIIVGVLVVVIIIIVVVIVLLRRKRSKGSSSSYSPEGKQTGNFAY